MNEPTLNDAQKKAIMFADGTMQVLAGPGSGKTFVMIRRIRYLIEQCGIESSSILAITFTKAAAEEMRLRFNKQLTGRRPLVNFGTFHAIFYHILRQGGQYRNFTLITETEKRKLLLQILQMPASLLFVSDEKIETLIRYISQIKNSGEDFDAVSQDMFPKKELMYIYQEYNQYLKEFKKLDFDDMGLLCLNLLRENPAILEKWREKYQYILIDEFQDVNQVQYQIIKYIAGPKNNLFIVGDDDQSIYGFRGAKPDIMRQFMEDYPKAEQVLLDVNYRCHEQIVERSMRVIDVNQNRIPKAIRAQHTEGAGVILQPFPNQEKEYEAMLAELKALIKSRKRDLIDSTAVLYRTNHECSLLAEKFLLNDIPFVMKAPLRSQYDHFVVKDLMAYLEFSYGNRNRDIFHLFMNRPLRYLRKDCARKNPVVLKELLYYYRNEINMQETSRKLFYDIEQIGKLRPYAAIQYIRQVVGYDDYLKETYGIQPSENLLQAADDFQKLAKKYKNFKELYDYIGQCRENVRKRQEEVQEQDVRKQNGIRLMTMHASKGLEFNTVYLPDLCEGRIPSGQSTTKEEIEEERRMFYVAMTRAKKELHLLYCTKKTGKDMPSRFLEPILKNKRIR